MVTRTKNGLTLLEVAISVVVLGIVSTTVAEVLQWSVAQHRAAERKRCALEIATTILDEFTVRDWSAITAADAAKINLSVVAAQTLRDPHLVVQVNAEKSAGKSDDAGKGLDAKRVSVEITWINSGSPQTDRVQLSTWVFTPRAGNGSK
jgi:prepilin-type N-terminal cleavage/methylation domain-containing protein